ncbi:MAG: ABC transporter permease [Deltaproteobacteria bacterium]|nr:ABC transporter permease [Deltaproteobacteria bacterium]
MILLPITEFFGRRILLIMGTLGSFLHFLRDIFSWTTRRPLRLRLLFKQMEFVGVKSIWIIGLTSFFTGAVFALQSGYVFTLFNMESMVGATVGMSLTRELAPVFTALMVTARACSSMAAQIGSMRVTEQVDALETMAVNPVHYLVVPRVWATTLMLPFLTMLFNFIGCVGAYFVGIFLLSIHKGPFMSLLYYYVDADDIFGGLLKSSIFGFVIAAISCFQGFKAREGAAGVGKATTQAVVASAVSILVLDYFLTTWILEFISTPGR